MPTARTIKRNYYVKTILKVMLITGAVAIASTSPRFWPKVLNYYLKNNRYKDLFKSFQKRKTLDTFSYLKSRKMIDIQRRNKQIYISLTDKGKKWAGKYQINDLEIKKPKTWDKRWRVVIFDIKDEQRIKRESLRGKLRQLNFYQIQKSVWVHPYECTEEIDLLRSFFGLKKDELKIILAEKIEDDQEIKKYFKV